MKAAMLTTSQLTAGTKLKTTTEVGLWDESKYASRTHFEWPGETPPKEPEGLPPLTQPDELIGGKYLPVGTIVTVEAILYHSSAYQCIRASVGLTDASGAQQTQTGFLYTTHNSNDQVELPPPPEPGPEPGPQPEPEPQPPGPEPEPQPEPGPEPEPQPGPEPKPPEPPGSQPGDVQIEVHAGQTVVVEVKSTETAKTGTDVLGGMGGGKGAWPSACQSTPSPSSPVEMLLLFGLYAKDYPQSSRKGLDSNWFSIIDKTLILGFDGRLFARFNPPLACLMNMPLVRIEEEGLGEPYLLRFGDRLVHKENGAEVKYEELSLELNSKSWKTADTYVGSSESGEPVLEIPKPYDRNRNTETRYEGQKDLQTGKTYEGRCFSWVEIRDTGNLNAPEGGVSDNATTKPGLDVTEILGWTYTPRAVAIVLDTSGSMADNLAGAFYRSGIRDDKAELLRPEPNVDNRLYTLAVQLLGSALFRSNETTPTNCSFLVFEENASYLKIGTSEARNIRRSVLLGHFEEIKVQVKNTGYIPGSRPMKAMDMAAEALRNSGASCRLMIVITDGTGNPGDSLSDVTERLNNGGTETALELVGFKVEEKEKAGFKLAKDGWKVRMNFAKDDLELKTVLEGIRDAYQL